MSFPSPGSSSSESAIVLVDESNKSSPSPSGKFCIVSHFTTEESDYAVFIVDLESPAADLDRGFIPFAPTILIDCTSMGEADFYCFCVLGSTLYLSEKIRRSYPYLGKSVYTYDLSSHFKKPDITVGMDKTLLRPAPEMLAPKESTSATLTPDGKRILVFSSKISYNPLRVDPLDSEFELYHPLQKKLPSLKDYLKKIGAKPAQLGIYKFAFISNSVFLIQIKFGVFTIDLDMPDPAWEKYCDPICAGIYDVIEDGKLWLTGSGAYDISNGLGDKFDSRKTSHIAGPSSFEAGFKYIGTSFGVRTIYDRQGNVFGIVRVQQVIQKHTNCAHMILDVCRFDLDKYRNDKKNVGADAHLKSRLIKSFKFIMEGHACYNFFIMCLAHIQQGTESSPLF